ncbi:hypothetical protein CU313_05600 [Prochlorococcus marinus str. MU1404]|uniref:hypothetical protein n=1 Tax=Prochlorococcus marinus TaxID=1219 RepID=UPI001ADCFAA2|nr:hypothetical protein [Prochlorococcus marinus]MBO8229873.1 hypothetical protein [Prochlorococcus marinus XMU1404]MBW3073342.1 hypothetical protein [Prochlorococcus marinus str. MU1404]MCR8545791.1 hypothetical protein [Prochlorococcus marinus CUG1432]
MSNIFSSKKINISIHNKLFYKIQNRASENKAFALPQILVLAIGISITLVGLMNVSINRLSTSKLSNAEMQAKNATESAFNSLRTLLNNSGNVPYYYYWLLKTCSIDSSNNECPTFGGGKYGNQWPGYLNKGKFRDPSTLYWVDTNSEWCDGISSPTCIGRQVAPACSYLGRDARISQIPWNLYSNSLDILLNGEEKRISSSINSSNIQSFLIKSTDFVGDEYGGENSVLFEGYNASSKDPNIKNSTNKIRANIEVFKSVSDSGFAFISAGENVRDENSLFLGNFKTLNNKQKGSILWRKNIDPNRAYFECNKIKMESGIKNYSRLPDNSNDGGGLWVQPLALPSRPMIKNQGQLGSIWNPSTNQIVCLGDQKFGQYFGPNCRFLEKDGFNNYANKDRTYTIDDLVVRGKDAYFGIVTTDKSRVTLIVRGSIDLSYGGRICHRHGGPNGKCGSGKPENLTILFQQPAQKGGKQRLECSSNGGIRYVKDKNLNIPINHDNNIPFNTFNLSLGTGQNNEFFSAFVYAPDTTFSVATPETIYYSRAGEPWNLVSTVKGVYALVDYPGGTSDQRTPKLFRNIKGGLIPYTTTPDTSSWDRNTHGFDDVFIIAAGRRGEKSKPQINSMLNMALLWDSIADNYLLVGFESQGNDLKFVDRNLEGRAWKVNLGNNPWLKDQTGDSIIHHYGMELRQVSDLSEDSSFKGSIWVKNACFDKNGKGEVSWDFNSNYKDDLVKRFNYNNQYYFGVPYYRGKSIKVWDTLRTFN